MTSTYIPVDEESAAVALEPVNKTLRDTQGSWNERMGGDKEGIRRTARIEQFY